MTDPQQKRAYSWEGAFTDWAGAHATKAEMSRAIKRCCGMYRVPAPAVFYASKNKRNGKKLTSLYDPNRHTIWIRPRHMNINTAAHEAAHAIVDWILGPHGESHGREWVGVLMVLFDKLKIAPKTALVAYAKTTRLAFSTPGLVGPKEIRRRYAARAKLAKCERRLFKWYGQ